MGHNDVEQALRAMDDEIRQRLSEGDYEAVRGLDLTGEEQTLVRDAAIDYPEVAGFAFETYIRVQGTKQGQNKGQELQSLLAHNDKFLLATQYVGRLTT